MCCNNSKIFAFSLAELMVLLLALSIMLAAAAPVITKRQPSETTAGLPNGSIIVWCDIPGNIPDGYSVCDNANHTLHSEIPDLTNRFVIGANNSVASLYNWSNTGLGACSSLTNCTHAFSISQIPLHTHAAGVLANDNFNHNHSVIVGNSGDHTHATSSTGTVSHQHAVSSLLYGPSGDTYLGVFLGSTDNSTTAPISPYTWGYKVGTGSTTDEYISHGHTAYQMTSDPHSHGGSLASSSDGTHSHTASGATTGMGAPTGFNFLYQHRNCYYIMKNLSSSW